MIYNDVRIEIQKANHNMTLKYEIYHIHKGWERRRFDSQPGRTNMSHEIRLDGWLGTTNDIEHTAAGHWQIESATDDTFIAARLDKDD